jgi:hypothetical protein
MNSYENQEATKALIDLKTGSIITTINQGDSIRRKEQDDYYRLKQQQTELQKDYGPFTWLLYTMKEDLNFNISDANLTRLIYLSTFLHYKGYLVDNQGHSICKGICKEILSVSEYTFCIFWNEMIDNNIFKYEDQRIFLNKSMFKKGKLNKDEHAIRLNCETIRYLYEHCQNVNGHKKLGYIFKIIPWINLEWNIVCWNPEETERRFINYMTLGDFAEKVGYERKNAKRLAKDLSDVKFKRAKEYEHKHAFLYVINDCFDPEKWIIVMNPMIYYGGTDYRKVMAFEF